MSCVIEAGQIQEALRLRFGSALTGNSSIFEPAAELLRQYSPHHLTFHQLAVQLEEVLFNILYEQLGPGMSVLLDDGTRRRVRMAELPEAVDDVMGVLFDSLSVYSVSCEALRDYSMETGSFSAMRCLYLHYADLMSPEERRVLARVIRGSFPPDRWRSWLNEEQ